MSETEIARREGWLFDSSREREVHAKARRREEKNGAVEDVSIFARIETFFEEKSQNVIENKGGAKIQNSGVRSQNSEAKVPKLSLIVMANESRPSVTNLLDEYTPLTS